MKLKIFSDADHMWTSTVAHLLDHSAIQVSRLGETREMIGYAATLENPTANFLQNSRRAISPAYAAAEVLWILARERRIDRILPYAPQYRKFAEDDIAHGAYGNRIATSAGDFGDQLELVCDLLRQDSFSRQAVISIYEGEDLGHSWIKDVKDVPCTLSLQFLIRANALHLIVTMRSQDVWLGLPYDLFMFTCLQWLVAERIGIEVGQYYHRVGSMHLYAKHFEAARTAVLQPLEPTPINDWDYRSGEDQLPQTLQFEEQLRNDRFGTRLDVLRETSVLQSDHLFHDLVLCCAIHHDFDVSDSIHSTSLKRGVQKYADHRRRRLSRQDDTV